ncbi:MAG: flagellar basal body L-ring protein FlgH [Verrucomicrobiota bacterium]
MPTKPIIHHKLGIGTTLVVGLVIVGLTSTGNASGGIGSLWPSTKTMYQSIYADDKASTVGDLITIVIDLSTVATKDQSTTTEKDTSLNEGITNLLFPPGGDWDWYTYDGNTPTFSWNSSRSHEGSGSIANSETLQTTIQARIIEIAPNGTMRIEARRGYETGKEHSELVLTGFIRQSDLTATNTISSANIAEMQILQKGTGTISRQQKKGWLTKFYEFLSPF